MSSKHPNPNVPGFTSEELVSKIGFCEQLKGGVIMDVVDPEQALIAEEAGACAVMALERVPADIRRDGGVARASDPDMIAGIQKAVSIPVMAKVRIGSFDHLLRLDRERFKNEEWNLDSASEKVVSKYCEIYSLVWFEGDYEGWTDDEMDADTSNEFDEMWHADWEEYGNKYPAWKLAR